MIILHSLGLFGVDGRKRPSATGMIILSLALARKQERKRQRAAEPMALTINGRFLVRNERLHVPASEDD